MTKITKICSYCQSEFVIDKNQYCLNSQRSNLWRERQCCSRACGAKLAHLTRSFWSEDEIQFLKKWIGKKPIKLIQQDWNKVAQHKGWAKRTPIALKIKATRLMTNQSGSVKSYEDNWDSRTLDKLLGLKSGAVRLWRRRGIINFTKLSSNKTCISRKQLKQFANEYPEELGGIDPKKLRKVLKDSTLVNNVLQVANNRPSTGRPITVVRLDTGDVYKSAMSAAICLAPLMGVSKSSAKGNILKVSNRNTPMRNGMDFYRIDYPVFWCPIYIRDDFNQLAGKILYQLYLEICQVTGYKKQSCLVVAARLAVEITLISFRIRQGDISQGNVDVRSTSAIAEFWQELLIKKLTYVYSLQPGYLLKKISDIITRRVLRNCYAIASGDKVYAEELCQDFINFFIEKGTNRFFKNSYLPINYRLTGKLAQADLWAYIYGSLNAYIRIGKKENNTEKKISLVTLIFYHFCRHYKLEKSEAKIDRFNPDWKKHNIERGNLDAGVSFEKPQDITLESLLTLAKEKYNDELYEKLDMFVALKLEDASDLEITNYMNINISGISKMISQLRDCV